MGCRRQTRRRGQSLVSERQTRGLGKQSCQPSSDALHSPASLSVDNDVFPRLHDACRTDYDSSRLEIAGSQKRPIPASADIHGARAVQHTIDHRTSSLIAISETCLIEVESVWICLKF